MKKIISIALVLILAVGFCFAADLDASIYLTGTIDKGYLPEKPGTGGSDILEDNGMTVLITVVDYEGSVDFNKGDTYKPSNYAASADKAKTVNLLGPEGDGLTSLVLAYGAYGNVGSGNNPNVSITIKTEGWKLDNESVSTLTLALNTTDSDETVVFTGNAENKSDKENVITITKKATGATTLEEVGCTTITWGVADGQKPPTAGTYTATITITVEGDGTSV